MVKTLYSEVLKVPLLLYYPKSGYKPARIKDNVSLLDILPTIREITGMPTDKFNTGLSLIPYLKNGNTSHPERYIYSHLQRKKQEFDADLLKKAVLHENWKYVISSPGSNEIFDLETDPKEKFDQISEKSYIANSLHSELTRFEDTCKKYTQKNVTIAATKEKLKEMKALGYLQ